MATWLAIRKPITGLRGTLLKFLGFLIPVGIWCAFSYCPFIWHPLTRVTDKGGSEWLNVGDTLPTEQLATENARLIAEKKPPASGAPANPIFLPEPLQVGKALCSAFTTEPSRRGDLWLHQSLMQSFKTIFYGFVLAVIIAIPLGIICGTFDFTAKMLEPWIDFIRYIPPPAYASLMVAAFGLFQGPKVAILFVGVFFNMVLVAANTTRTIDPALLEAARTLGARRFALLLHVILPGALPGLFKDVRILLGSAWTYLMLAELIGEMNGISLFINQQGRYRHYDNVFAGMLIIGTIGFATDQLLAFFATLIFPWTSEANHRVRRWLRWFAPLLPPVKTRHPEPHPRAEHALFTQPRNTAVPYSADGVATPQFVAAAPAEARDPRVRQEAIHAGR
jgi:NitT/TauT family transport system permease protein